MPEPTVRILHGALDEEAGDIVLRGRIDPDSLDALMVDDYQREVQPLSTINGIMKGFKAGAAVPDIHLSLRGSHVTDNGSTYTLRDPVYIVDGLQRVSAAKHFRFQGGVPRLGATVYFDKSKEWEVDHFKTLNVDLTKLSSNVMLRNMREQFPVVATLYSLTEEDNQFVLKGRVCWKQRKMREHLVTSVTLLKVVGALHSHLGSGLSGRIFELAPGVEKIMERVGRNIFRANIRTFFELLDNCFGLRVIAFTEGACQIRSTFMMTLARVLSDHLTFWREDDKKLFIEAQLIRKFKGFPIQDPTVQQLSGAGGQAEKLLYQLMVEHFNRGKRTQRLRARKVRN
jgi:hypothetical protein